MLDAALICNTGVFFTHKKRMMKCGARWSIGTRITTTTVTELPNPASQFLFFVEIFDENNQNKKRNGKDTMLCKLIALTQPIFHR